MKIDPIQIIFIGIQNEVKNEVVIITSLEERLSEYSCEYLAYKSLEALDDSAMYHDNAGANPHLLKSIAYSNIMNAKILLEMQKTLKEMNDNLVSIKNSVNQR